MIRFGSLFSGIGGLDLGLERAGLSCAWQVESDDYARTILRKHWPSVPKWSDVRNVGAHCLERVELICGGFPCQDISQAGNGVGIEGERSGLWREFHRIVRELRPRLVLVENVPMLRQRGLGVVLGALASIGYDSEWDCVPAAAVGAPHRRDRIFIVASLADADRGGFQERRVPEPGGLECARGRIFDGCGAERELRDAAERGRKWWETEPPVGRVANGIPGRVDRLRGLGNSVVPAVAEFIGRRLMAAER